VSEYEEIDKYEYSGNLEGSQLFPIRMHNRETNPPDHSSKHTEDVSALIYKNTNPSLAKKDCLIQLLFKYAGSLAAGPGNYKVLRELF
jgi:hypothetical protein